MIKGRGSEKGYLSDEEACGVIREALFGMELLGKKVLAIIPDHTRSGPTGFFFRQFCEQAGGKARKLDFLIALGTHPVMTEEKILEYLGISADEKRGKYGKFNIFNHRWDLPETFKTIGKLSKEDIRDITNGLFEEEVPVTINKMLFQYDLIMIYGPVFPHEVVGFSGGDKYLFPGVSGREVINFFHWLGAVITNIEINGRKSTRTREVIERAASFVDVPRFYFCSVVADGRLKGLFAGDSKEAWSAAADLSAKVNMVYKGRTYKKVLGIAPEMYDDLWTAGKVMYKLEPVVEDNGELIIYAPHIKEVSGTHGKDLDKIGYHVRDYFYKRMKEFRDVPGGVMAHSTHVKGLGTYVDGEEAPRIKVILATGIPEEKCRKINLGYMNPEEIDISKWEGREDEGILVVHHAGEVLHKPGGNINEQ